MSDLDDTQPSTERPGANGAATKTPAELRHEGLLELFEAFSERTEELGKSIAFLHLDTRLIRDGNHEIRSGLDAVTKNTETLLEAHRHLTAVVTEIRNHMRRETPDSSPPSLVGDRASDQ